ncbi:MAG: DegV family protein [Acutalibacteraceae bacterium]|nr:DegV family protein [Acutalibacteraceae bacterium]
MYRFEIIPDTSSDLTKDLRDRFGINDYLHGIMYHPNGKEEVISLDWETMTPKEYYDSMKGRQALYTTATPRIGEIYELFEKYLSKGIDVLSISLSSGLSASYANTVTVAEELRVKYPERKIICIDSKRYSTSLSLLIIKACLKRDEGASIDEVADYINSIKDTVHQIGSMDDLFFLVKTGRVTNFKALFGQMIGLNIMADFNQNGMSEVIGKIKGQRDAIDADIKYMRETITNPEEQIVFVAHTNREAAAQLLAKRIKEEICPKEVILHTVGMACGATIGPGLCAAFYLGKPISENLNDEKALMANIIENQKRK